MLPVGHFAQLRFHWANTATERMATAKAPPHHGFSPALAAGCALPRAGHADPGWTLPCGRANAAASSSLGAGAGARAFSAARARARAAGRHGRGRVRGHHLLAGRPAALSGGRGLVPAAV